MSSPATPVRPVDPDAVSGSAFHTPPSSARRSPDPSSTTKTPDSVGRRRAQFLADAASPAKSDYWKSWRLTLEYKKLAALASSGSNEIGGLYVLPNLPPADASRWHGFLVLPPNATMPSPYAGSVIRLAFDFPDAFGDEAASDEEARIVVTVLSAPFYHPLVDPISGVFHFPERLLPKDKPRPDVADLAKVLKRAFSATFLESLSPDDLNSMGNPDALHELKSDFQTFQKIAHDAAEQSACEDALYDAARSASEGEFKVRRKRWDDKEIDDAMELLELAMEVNLEAVLGPFFLA